MGKYVTGTQQRQQVPRKGGSIVVELTYVNHQPAPGIISGTLGPTDDLNAGDLCGRSDRPDLDALRQRSIVTDRARRLGDVYVVERSELRHPR